MDSEDRDHFKTIANQSAERQVVLRKPQDAENSRSGLDPAYCLNRTKILFACYRKDEAHDAELYCAAVASTFEGFSRAAVDYVTDPRTGIASELKFLPSVAEVRECCVRAETRIALLAKPNFKFERHQYHPPVKREPGTSYFEMFEKHGRPIGRFEFERVFERVCADAGIDPKPEKLDPQA